MMGLALVVYLALTPLGGCTWSEGMALTAFPPISYGGVSAVEHDDALYLATYAYKYLPNGDRIPTVFLRTRGGDDRFEREIYLEKDKTNIHVELISQEKSLHLLWAVSSDSITRREESSLNILYWSKYSDGYWSPPKVVLHEKKGLNWYPGVISDIEVGSNGTMHLVVPLELGSGLVFLQSDGLAWKKGHSPARTASYVDIWVAGADTVYSVLIGSELEMVLENRDNVAPNSVVFRASYDGGKSWEEPVLIHKSREGAASLPDIVVTEAGRLYVAWGMNLSGGSIPQAIGLSVSQDGGSTWSSADRLDYRGGILRRATLVEACERINVVFEIFRHREDFGIYSAHKRNGTWSEPSRIAHGMGYSVVNDQGADVAVFFQSMLNEEDVFSAEGKPVVPETIVRVFHAN